MGPGAKRLFAPGPDLFLVSVLITFMEHD